MRWERADEVNYERLGSLVGRMERGFDDVSMKVAPANFVATLVPRNTRRRNAIFGDLRIDPDSCRHGWLQQFTYGGYGVLS